MIRQPALARLAAVSLLIASVPAAQLPAGSFVAFESGHVRPIALSPSKDLLFAVNTPDNRLEVFRATDAGLERAGEVFVGLEPVAVAARTEDEVYVVNHLSDSVSVVDVSDPARPRVRATLLTGDEPRDVVIAGPARDRVFVTAAHRGQNRPGDPQLTTPGVGRADVWVFDAGDLSAAPRILTLFSDTPRALAASPDGSRVYAAAFHSGNKTTVLEQLAVTADPTVNAILNDGFTAPGAPAPTSSTGGVPAPETGLILKHDGARWRDPAGRDWSSRVRFNLPDKDLFIIDAASDPPAVIGDTSGLGTVLFNIAVHPVSGKVYVSNIDSRNHVRFEPVVNGHIAESRITIVDGAAVTPVHLNQHIDYSTPSGPPGEIALSLAFPLGMEFSADGEKLYAAAFGSAAVAVLDAQANIAGRIPVGGGPSGLALDEGRGRLYVLNRFDQTISIVATAAEVETAVVPLRYDPEPPAVRDGRPLLYDARRSGHGDSACASCHIFGDFDSLAWDLGDPAGAVEENPIVVVSVQGGPLEDFHPMKGPMTTQSLRGMMGAGAMHWRGDRNGGDGAPFDEGAAFMAFRPAFQGLLGMGSPLPVEDMERFRDFILEVQYPPNPIARIDGALTAAEAAGKQVFDSNGSRSGVGGDGDPCASCHTLPFGTDGHGSFEGLTQDFKVAHLRNLYQKVGMFGYALPSIASDSPSRRFETTPTPHRGDQVRGFGFLHDGSVPTLHNFFRFPLGQFTFPDQAGRTGDQKIRELEAFMLAFPTGLAPCVGQQVTLDAGSIDAPSLALDRYALLRARSEAGDSDLVVRGIIGGRERGFLHEGGGLFQSDRAAESMTEGQLADLIRAGAVLTVTAAPPGSGARMAIDRDEDGHLDGDEVELGSDPADPSSVPGPATPFLRGDCAPSGSVDLSDAVASLDYIFRQAAAPTCLDACDSNGDGAVDVSDGLFTLFFLFAGGRTPGLHPACEPATGACAGDFGCP
jgi:YVTN family beta-propeller protein